MAVKFSPLEMTGKITEKFTPTEFTAIQLRQNSMFLHYLLLYQMERGIVNLFLWGYPILWFTFISIERVQLVGIAWFQVQFQINSTLECLLIAWGKTKHSYAIPQVFVWENILFRLQCTIWACNIIPFSSRHFGSLIYLYNVFMIQLHIHTN